MKPKALRILEFLLKAVFSLFIIAVCTILIWRVFFSSKLPSEVKGVAPTAAVTAAYEERGDALILRYQDQASITRAEKNYGYFSVVQALFIPEANEIQIVFRYNNSTIKNLALDYELEAVPEKSETLFDVSLYLTAKEGLGEDRRVLPNPELTTRAETSLYTYYRYVFEDVCTTDATEGVFADIYYLGDLDYEKEAYGTLCLYDYTDVWFSYSLTGTDKKALAKAVEGTK